MRIYFSFLVFNAMVFLMRDSGLVFAFYTTCAIHEAGHLIALKITGGRTAEVSLSGAGIRIDVRRNGMASTGKGLFVLLAGPAANIAVYLLMKLLGCGGDFPVLNILAAGYNLLPYRSLDGGAVIRLFTTGTEHERLVENVLTALKLLIVTAAGAAVYFYGKNALPLLIGALALFVGDVSLKK